MNVDKKISSLIGMAYRSRNVVLGVDNIVKQMASGKVSLVLIVDSTSLKTQKKIQDKAYYYNCDTLIMCESGEFNLAKAVGKNNVKVLGIKDPGFKNKIQTIVKGD